MLKNIISLKLNLLKIYFIILFNIIYVYEISDNNIDYFLTQKPYILIRSNRRNRKKPNNKATFLCGSILLKYVLKVLREAPKDNRVSENVEIKEILHY